MKQWLKIPREQRRELRSAYKQAGYSYMEAVKDFETELPKMQQGGRIPYYLQPEESYMHSWPQVSTNTSTQREEVLADDISNFERRQQQKTSYKEIPTHTPTPESVGAFDTINNEEFRQEFREKMISKTDAKVDQETTRRQLELENKQDVGEFTPPVVVEGNSIDISKPAQLQKSLLESGYDVGVHGVDGKVGKDTVKALQSFLIDQGYDLGEFGSNKDGIDGIMGKKTREAINHYNEHKAGQSQGLFSERGKSWKCPRGSDQCAESVDFMLIDNYNLTDKERLDAGIFGDAWERERNITRNGGQLIYKRDTDINNTHQFSPGDMVFLHNTSTVGSSYQQVANSVYGADKAPTHTGMIDSSIQYDNNNRPFVFVVHNIRGTIHREKLFLNSTGNPRLGGHSSFELVSAVRPNIEGLEAIKITPDPSIRIEARDNPIASNAANALLDTQFRERARRNYNLSENESLALTQAVLGIMEQETGMGDKGRTRLPNRAELFGKEVAASLAGSAASGRELLGKTIPQEASRGWGQIKFDTNFRDKAEFYESEFGIRRGNISAAKDDGTNSAIATYLILANNYNRLKNKFSEEDALYLAVQQHSRYNLYTRVAGRSGIEWGQDRDLDYVNKVLAFSQKYKLGRDEDTPLKTMWDQIASDSRVVRNQIRLGIP